VGERCGRCDYWDRSSSSRIPNTYAVCKRVEGPDAPFDTLVYMDGTSSRLITRAEFGCSQFRPVNRNHSGKGR
jgi:hypothetical protein